jgi:hypothetical protein
VTGHSLGAGAAILLSVILRPAFPSLHCFAFGTPGSLLDPRSCDEYSSFVTTTVMNNDLVCRLSFPSLCQLRNSVLDAISRARVNKMMIMHAIFKDLDSEDLMYPAGQEPDSAFKRGITVFKALMEKRLAMLQVELSLPGRIVHFKKSEKPPVCSFKKTTYSIRMAPRSDFQEILVSTTMVSICLNTKNKTKQNLICTLLTLHNLSIHRDRTISQTCTTTRSTRCCTSTRSRSGTYET